MSEFTEYTYNMIEDGRLERCIICISCVIGQQLLADSCNTPGITM